jgi:hypothetical protein
MKNSTPRLRHTRTLVLFILNLLVARFIIDKTPYGFPEPYAPILGLIYGFFTLMI